MDNHIGLPIIQAIKMLCLITLVAIIVSSSAFSVPSIEQAVSSNADRDMEALKSWASENKVLRENGFELNESNDGDWSVSISENGKEAHRVLQVPSHLVLASTKIRKELEDQFSFSAAMEHLEKKKVEHQIPQFFLWLKILREYENGENSLWHPWLQSLPRSFSNAISMDEVELECLAPFAWSLATIERLHLDVFHEALDLVDGVLNEDTKNDIDATTWAFNVVFTRAWSKDGEDDRTDIVPLGDMFNHRHPGNVYIHYDEEGNCNVVLKDDTDAGTPIYLSYGRETNPYRFMVVFGFVDESQESIFSQIVVSNPSQRHVDIGYDLSKMVFNTTDGAISEEAWDILLFSLLEQVPSIQEAFYQAHKNEDFATKDTIRRRFYLETCIMLKKHVDSALIEMQALLQKIDGHDISRHRLLPMIRRSNELVARTFSKAKGRIDQMIKEEMAQRKALETKI